MRLFDHNDGEYLEVDGAGIYFEETGSKEKPALLILHGGFESIQNMNPVVSWLSDDYRVIGIDSRGHGKSTLGEQPLTYKLIQSDIEAVLDHLGIDAVTIIGFSDGGILGYRIAADRRVKVERLVAIGASWSVDDVCASEKIMNTINPDSARELFADNYKDYMKLNPEADFDKFTNKMVDMWLDKSENGHPDNRVGSIESDTLIIRGDNDFLVSAESLVALQKRIKGSLFMNVPYAAHVVHREQEDIVKSVVNQFLNK